MGLHTGKIFVTGNLVSNNWSIDTSEIGPRANNLYFSFVDGNAITQFRDLSFMYRLSTDGEVIKTQNFPPEGEKYIETDEEYLVLDRIKKLEIEKEYELYVWAEHDGHTFESTVTFTTPRPDQPYESWIWNADTARWEPPVQRPEDENFAWHWDEASESWIKSDHVCYSKPNTQEIADKPVELDKVEFMKRLNSMAMSDGTNVLEAAESAYESGQLSTHANIMWKYATSFKLADSNLKQWAQDMNITDEQLDSLFEVVYVPNTVESE